MSLATARAPFHVALDDEEWHFVRSLREIPPSPLRDRASDLIRAILDFTANPGCPEAQADGVPCTSAHTACDRCQEVTGLLDELLRRVRGF